jgi:hypothetical protein
MRFVLFFIGKLILAPLIALVYGFLVMLLWNWLMPAIFGLPAIDFWQSWGLVLLAHLLFRGASFGGPHGHHHRHRFRHRHAGHGHRGHAWKRRIMEKVRAQTGPETQTGGAGEPY